jgi:hypothetical protein
MAEEEALTDRALSESLDEDIRSTLREIQSRPENQPEEPAPVKVEAEAPAPEKAEKPRAPDGKFVAAKEAKDSVAPATPDTPEKPKAAPGPAQAAAEPEETLKFGKVEVDLTRPPSSWKPAAKAAWAALPLDVQKEIYRRETDFSNTVLNGPLKETADFGREVKSVIEPYRMLIEAEGGTPARAIADTMRTAALFRTGSQDAKRAALYQIDKQFNCGFEAEFQRLVQQEVAKITGGQPQAGQPAAQPGLIQDSRYDALAKQFETVTTALQAQERERQAREEKASLDSVQAFWNAKDDKGQPKYPFIDNVLDDMTFRVQQLRRQNPALDHATALEQAYEAAVWANPETRQVLISQQQAPAVQLAESQRKVQEARRAQAGNLPKRGGLPASAPEQHLRLGTPESDAAIRETLRSLQTAH